jgi:TonB family protein
VPPLYPPLARKAGIEGDVALDVVIGKGGSVQSAVAVRGDPYLTQSAVDAVNQWKYKPSGAEARTQVNIHFTLENPGQSEPTATATQNRSDTAQREPEFNGDSVKMLELAHSYENGTGVTENYEEALKWLRRSADSGNVDAMLEFGLYCETGNHMAKDKNEALAWYRKAIEHGSKSAVSSAMGVNGAKNREVKTVEHCPDGASTNFSERLSKRERWFYPLCIVPSILQQTDCPNEFFYFGGECVTGLAQCPSGYTLESLSAHERHIKQLSYTCHITDTSIAPDKLALEPVFIGEEKEACSNESDANFCRADFLRAMKYKRVRLSPNGSMGVIVALDGTSLCGSGGCPLFLLRQTGKESRKVWKGQGSITGVSVENTTTNGFYDISDRQRAHNQSTFQRYSWAGAEYVDKDQLDAKRAAEQRVAKQQSDAIGYSMELGPDGGPGVELVGTVTSTSQVYVLDQVGNKLTRQMVTFRLDFPDHSKQWVEAICLHKELGGGSGTPGETAPMTLECQPFIPGKRYRFVSSSKGSLLEFHPVSREYPLYLYQGWKWCEDNSCTRLGHQPIEMIRRSGGEIER